MKTIKLIGWIVIALSIASSAIFFAVGYPAFISFLKNRGVPPVITLPTYYRIGGVLAGGVVIGAFLLFCSNWILARLRNVQTWGKRLWLSFTQSLRNTTKTERILLAAVLAGSVLVKGYFACTFPITYDEAWTYLNFTSRGLVYSMSYYPAPNNHILNSIFTNLFSSLPIGANLVMRLPAFLANHLFLLVFFLFLRKEFNLKLATVVTLICSFLPPIVIYGFMGRGYSFVLLFFLVSFIATVRILQQPSGSSRYFFLLTVSSVLGFYTMPSFLYPYATLCLFMLFFAVKAGDRVLAKRLFLWGLLTVFLVVVLYAPVIVISGIKSLVANPYVLPVNRSTVLDNLAPHFSSTFEFLFFHKIMVVVAPLICILALLKKERRPVAGLNAWILFFGLLIPVLHSVLPFLRTWIYFIVPVLLSFSFLSEQVITRVKALPLSLVCMLVVVASTLEGYRVITFNEQQAMQTKGLADYLLGEDVRSVYIEEPLTDAFVLYAFRSRQKDIRCYIHNEDYRANDTSIQMLILQKGAAINQPPVYQNDYVGVYHNPSFKQLPATRSN